MHLGTGQEWLVQVQTPGLQETRERPSLGFFHYHWENRFNPSPVTKLGNAVPSGWNSQISRPGNARYSSEFTSRVYPEREVDAKVKGEPGGSSFL